MTVYKRILVSALAALTFFSAANGTAYASSGEANVEMTLSYNGADHIYSALPIHLDINGEEITDLPMPPIIMNDLTLVPAREVFEKLGAVVTWDGANQEVIIGYNDTVIQLNMGKDTAEINGDEVGIDPPPLIINDKTMIPLRFVSENLGFSVGWNGDTRTASVDSPQPTPAPTPVPTPTPAGTPAAPTPAPYVPKDLSAQTIVKQNNPEVQINSVLLPVNSCEIFTIQATGPVSRVDKIYITENNRLAIDIYNAVLTASVNTVEVNDGVVARVRMGQNQITPDEITRVVFDLDNPEDYGVALSPDRTCVYVAFGAAASGDIATLAGNTDKNTVNAVTYDTDGTNDIINIFCDNPQKVNLFHLADPDRLVIDLPFATLGGSVSDIQTAGVYISGIRAGQFDAQTARVVLDLTAMPNADITQDGSVITVTLSLPTFHDIAYDSGSHVITMAKPPGISAADITVDDEYNSLKYTLTFPNGITDTVGYGNYGVGDSYLGSFDIGADAGNMQITLNENRVLATDITEDDQNIYIKILDVKEKYSKIVILDAGHGDNDPGASYNGLVEKDLNLDVVLRVRDLLEQDGSVKVYCTRTDDTFVPLDDRAAFGNAYGDIFVSVHMNAGGNTPTGTNTKANGTETYYYNHDDQDAARGFSGQQLAQIMQDELLSHLGSLDRTVQFGDLAVLRESDLPATLVEVGFLSNTDEAAKLATPEYRQEAAQAIYEGVIKAFSIYTPAR